MIYLLNILSKFYFFIFILMTKKKEKEIKLWESPEYSEKEIKEFKEEIARKPNEVTLTEFSAITKKDLDELSESDIRVLIYKMGYLSDAERYKFRSILVREKLTDEELKRYIRIYPVNETFDRFFPSADNVEEHYKIYFLNR